jgi:thioredoxin reductase
MQLNCTFEWFLVFLSVKSEGVLSGIEKRKYSVIIIGAGAAGLGMAVFLKKSGFDDFVIIEKSTMGSSFSNWPKYTRFISPSFTGNFFNAVDLNAISPDTSPAFTLKTEHPTGEEYLEYLQVVAKHFKLPICENTEVTSVEKKEGMFHIESSQGMWEAPFVVWAGGEFQNPKNHGFAGASHCIHSSQIDSFPEEEYVIIGGFESGMELSAHLLEQKKRVVVIDAEDPWSIEGSDSSLSLAPATLDRLRPFFSGDSLRLISDSRVSTVEQFPEGYKITLSDGKEMMSQTKPILATGFYPLSKIVQEHFESNEDGVLVTEEDESTKIPGLFLVGPGVRHKGAIFCFIYKFRQRFPIVGGAILERLHQNPSALKEYKEANMYLEDLSCCTDECSC